MPHYRQVGDVPPKRHTQFRGPDGVLRVEELMGQEGFSSDSSLLYHRRNPSGMRDARAWAPGDLSVEPNHPLTPRHLRLHDLFAQDDAELDAVQHRRLVLGNADVRISYVRSTVPSPLYRNAVGDECVFVQGGTGTVETVFGSLSYRPGDYVIIPRATTHRWLPDGPSRLYAIEANSHIQPPRKYLSRFGQLLEHAPYCERDLTGPDEPLVAPDPLDEGEGEGEGGDGAVVYVKHRGPGPLGVVGTVMTLGHHPFDVVGWDGCLYPYTFNVEDFEPITGRIHQPPPVHQVFEARNFVVCNFLPRKVDYHPDAIPVPYHHSNVDSDEVMFYVAGNYEARRGSGIDVGSVSLHPSGLPHGPQPGAVEASLGVEEFDEVAVMVDTFAPLHLGEAARASDDGVYANSWVTAGGAG